MTEETVTHHQLPSTRRVVGVSLAVDVLDITTNLVVASLTGSAVIFAEMVQGVADAIGSLLLVIGERRSRLPGDPTYPSGHTREVFFWALLSALVMLVVGSGFSAWRGLSQLLRPEPLEHPYLALGILVFSALTNGYAVTQSLKRLRASGESVWRAFREEGQPLVKTAFLQDTLGTGSAVVGLVSLLGYAAFGDMPVFDAAGALAIAGLMVTFAVVLIVQMHHFITGRPVPREIQEKIRGTVAGVPGVESINGMVATFVGSAAVRVELDLDLSEGLTTLEIEALLDTIQREANVIEPRVMSVKVDLNSPAGE